MDIQVRLIAKKVFLVLMALVLSVTAGQAWANADKSGQSIYVAAVNKSHDQLEGQDHLLFSHRRVHPDLQQNDRRAGGRDIFCLLQEK